MPSLVRINHCANPAFQVDATPWGNATRVTGLTGMTRTTGATAPSFTPCQYEATGVVTPGEVWTVSVDVRNSADATTLNVDLEWRDSGGFFISNAQGNIVGTSSKAVTAEVPVRFSATDTAPGGAVSVVLSVYQETGTVTVTAALVERATGPLDYFDGGSTGGRWSGTSGSSTSNLTVPSPVASLAPARARAANF